MKCPNCGASVSENDKFCRSCGAQINGKNDQTEGDVPPIDSSIYGDGASFHGGFGGFGGFGTQPPPPPFGGSAIPMRWYNFLINFALYAVALLNVINAFMYFSGLAYVNMEGTIVTKEYYATYQGMQLLDLSYAVLLLGSATFAVLTRFALAKLKKGANNLVLVYFGVSAGINILYTFLTLVLKGTYTDPASLLPIFTAVLIQIIFIVLNHTYFSKRKHLFTVE